MVHQLTMGKRKKLAKRPTEGKKDGLAKLEEEVARFNKPFVDWLRDKKRVARPPEKD